jgi:cytoskeletal protein CcmA (bactofilin family)
MPQFNTRSWPLGEQNLPGSCRGFFAPALCETGFARYKGNKIKYLALDQKDLAAYRQSGRVHGKVWAMGKNETDFGSSKGQSRSGQGSFIGAGCALEGQFDFSGPITIAGHLKGPVKSDAMVLIESSGHVEGSLEAAVIVVHGKLTGNVTAHESLEIWNEAQVTGKVFARSIRVDAGSLLTADLKVSTDGPVPAHDAAAPADTSTPSSGPQPAIDPNRPASPLPGSNLARKLSEMNDRQ